WNPVAPLPAVISPVAPIALTDTVPPLPELAPLALSISEPAVSVKVCPVTVTLPPLLAAAPPFGPAPSAFTEAPPPPNVIAPGVVPRALIVIDPPGPTVPPVAVSEFAEPDGSAIPPLAPPAPMFVTLITPPPPAVAPPLTLIAPE